MSGRRSRLQIKPNIGGVKSGPGKPPARKPKNEKETASVEKLSEDKDSDITKASSPRTDEHTNIHGNLITVDDYSGSKTTLKSQDSGTGKEQLVGEAVNEDSIETVKNNEHESNILNSDSNKDDKKESSVSVRARLNRFGKVNFSAIKKKESVDKDVEKSDDKNNSSGKHTGEKIDEKVKTKVEASKSVHEDDDKKEKKGEISPVKSSTAIPRRSRFPKAKPNVIDANKRRQKASDKNETKEKNIKESEPASTSNIPSSASIPAITVTTADEENVEKVPVPSTPTTPSVPKSDQPQPAGGSVQMTQIQSRPTLPKSPIKSPVTPSLLASPVKSVGAGAEKRQRTQSTSEPVVIKRSRKPRVDAPTDKPPDRTTMKMRDLIRWNPKSNPMKVKEKPQNQEIVISNVEKDVEKENVGKKAADQPDETDGGASALPVPQVTIGPDGNIIINEKSLVVDNPDTDKTLSQDNGIIDETDLVTTYASFRKTSRSRRWTKKETVKFYKALGMVGIDFFLIHKLFPDRSRLDIKKKFKREDKLNRVLIEKVLRERLDFDAEKLDGEDGEESSEDEELIRQQQRKEKRTLKEKAPKESKKKRKAAKKVKTSDYFDDSLSEEEDEEEDVPKKKQASTSRTATRSCDNQKDGEVVSILMDMSEGRLPASGQSEDNVVSTGVQTQTQSTNTVTLPQRSVSHTQTKYRRTESSLNNTQQLRKNASHQQVVPCLTARPAASHQVQRPFIGHSATQNVSNERASQMGSVPSGYQEINNTSSHSSNEVLPFMSPRTAESFNQGSAEMQIMSPRSARETSSALGLNANLDDAGQYVLVTVVPENGDETVIHIYRLHGGAQMQEGGVNQGEGPSQEVVFNQGAEPGQGMGYKQEKGAGLNMEEGLVLNQGAGLQQGVSFNNEMEVTQEVRLTQEAGFSQVGGSTQADMPAKVITCDNILTNEVIIGREDPPTDEVFRPPSNGQDT